MKSSLLLFLFSLSLSAQVATTSSVETSTFESERAEDIQVNEEDTIYIIGSQERTFYTPGSAHFIDKKELQKFKYQDVNRVLDKVPGVYIQEEDGLGLRPNIGLRGAHPHRSKKVTLMEDGILVGPAPYAAPAAYYFPSTSRLDTMEVFKGPSSVQYGPNSVGGAINMVTKPLQGPKQIEVELSSGTFTQMRVNNRGSKDGFSWFIEANRKQGDLLRDLPNGEEADFEQNDFLLKLGQRLPGNGHSIETKLSYATEDSDETYLGLTFGDFNQDAFVRYSASQDDNLQYQRFAGQITHKITLPEGSKLTTALYHHQMRRDWEKFNDFAFRQDFRSVLNGAADTDDLISLLRGTRDSANEQEYLLIGSNDRRYFSQGVQATLSKNLDWGATNHDLSLGLRVHRDQVRRDHTEVSAAMIGGELVYQNDERKTNTNQDTSQALALYAQDEILIGNLATKVGFRVERVEHERDPRTESGLLSKNSESVFVPGIGFNYSLNNNAVLLAGINKGVTLVGPGQSDDIEPEEAINYEAGFRIKAPLYFETIAFYSDYKNLKGVCSFSSGCSNDNIDTEFNGGAGEIYGLESLLSHTFQAGAFSFPVRLGYTFTVARFKNAFINTNPEWGPTGGQIRVNDPMPYVPQNQFNLGAGLTYKAFSFDLNLTWKDQIADQAVAENRALIPSYGVIDTAIAYRYSRKGKFFFRVNNILDNSYLVSLRPFGARPGSPRTVVAGFNQTF